MEVRKKIQVNGKGYTVRVILGMCNICLEMPKSLCALCKDQAEHDRLFNALVGCFPEVDFLDLPDSEKAEGMNAWVKLFKNLSLDISI